MNRRTVLNLKTWAPVLLLGLAATSFAVAAGYAAGDVALNGYCPVAYVAMDKAVEGSPEFTSEFQGRTYQLANGKAKKMFDKDAPAVIAKADENWPTVAAHAGH